MKRIKELEKYKIKYYSATRLFQNGVKKDQAIYCNKEITDYAYISTQVKDNCHLFEQSQKVLGGYSLDLLLDIFIIIDFEKFSEMDELKKYPNGFYLTIGDKEIHFIDFLKSNSMSKESMIYYVNYDFYEKITPRIYFDFDKASQMVLSKWYAYSGLCLTDCYILDSIKLKFEEVAIIPDLKKITKTNCITAVSLPLLIDKAIKLNQLINKYLSDDIPLKDIEDVDIIQLVTEINCYYNSPSFNDMPENKDMNIIRSTIRILKNATDLPVFKAIEALNMLKGPSIDTVESVKWYRFFVYDFPVEVNYFDGEGLMSLALANKINRLLTNKKTQYKDEDSLDEDELATEINKCGSFQIRLPFIKGVVHSCDFKKFFKSKNITRIKGLTFNPDNPYYEYDVNKLKLIITESQFKAGSFIKAMEKVNNPVYDYFDKLSIYDYSLGISSFEPNRSNNVDLNYQFISTLPLSINEVDSLIFHNKQILEYKISEPAVIESLRTTPEASGVEIYDKNRELYLSLPKYWDERKDIFESQKKKLMLSKLKVSGCRKLLCGDLLKLLYHSCGLGPQCKELNNEIYISNYSDYLENPNVVMLRNPHYSRNEIAVARIATNGNNERDTYFSHLKGVVLLNPDSLLADRLGGADYDGDTAIIINHKDLLDSVLPKLTNNGEMLYPIVKIPSISTKRIGSNTNSYEDRIDCLQNTFSNKTGVISNIAFGKSFDAYKTIDPFDSLQQDMAFFTILGGLEIDSAKNGKKPALPKITKKHDYLVVKDSFKTEFYDKTEVQTAIENILDSKEANTLFYVFSKFSDMKLENAEKSYKLKINPSTNRSGVISAAAIIEAYGKLKSSIKDYSNVIRGGFESEQATIKKIIIDILSLNNYDINVNELLRKCQLNKPGLVYFSYVRNLSNPFHYMSDYNDKLEYINSLGLDLPLEYIDAICNFKNGGYKLLFLLLKYHSYLSHDFEIADNRPVDRINKGIYAVEDFIYIRKKALIKTLSDSEIQEIGKRSKNIVDKIYSKIMTIMKYSPITISDMRLMVVKELSNMTSGIMFEDLCTVVNFKATDLSYSVFRNKLIEYLDKVGEVNG